MDLMQFLKSRKHGLSDNIYVNENTILLKDIYTEITLNNWLLSDINKFDDFLSKYTFPENDELSKKHKNEVYKYIPRPQVIIEKKSYPQIEANPIIALYLYQKEFLTGNSPLHTRSINKFEQMYIPYFVKTLSTRNNPQIIRKDNYEYCQSADFNFDYDLINNTKGSARLRILTFSFNKHVLFMYVFDKKTHELTQGELDSFIEQISQYNS